MRVTLLLVLACAACVGPFAPDEFWCSQTHYFTVADSLVALPDSIDWDLAPDSVVTVWSIEGDCP